MPSLADVAPPDLAAEEMDIRGTKLKIRGLSGDEWAAIYTRFPEFGAGISGLPMAETSALANARRDAAMIAAALDAPGDAATEALALQKLSREDQQAIIAAALRLSHPGHLFGPLLNGAAQPGPAPATGALVTK